ncbi:Putative glucose uptake permease [Listeria grayi]|uniref:Glucose uptake protein GlcU n=1 Tax=Listeria grayi FSL F6-1183 TaxID=1265827 RepID=A0A829RB64_LISGR|nr:GRP family sugar transporter [Listeria grayi]EUJ30678.1 glucose uptake protein GlcU [Listeria grayi FSL F6-1183]VEI31600.1 Putative glucose uptake permease [Listeria grayi]
MSGFMFALLPVLGWGFMPILANLRKSTPEEQLLGTSISAFLFAVVATLIVLPAFTVTSFVISLCSGIFWGIGQLLQFRGIRLSSVSTAMPISNGSQLLFATLIAVLFFHEWKTAGQVGVGILATCLLIIGVIMTGFKKQNQTVKEAVPWQVYQTILLSSLFLSFYVVTNQAFHITGFSIILPQSVGMLIFAFAVNYFKAKRPIYKNVRFNLLTGLSWSIANIGMFLATITLGVATSFSISQACVIIATLFGIWIFKEKKAPIEWSFILTGILLIMASVVLLGMMK